MHLDANVPKRQVEVYNVSCWLQTPKSIGEILYLTLLLAVPLACFCDLGQIILPLFFSYILAFLLKTLICWAETEVVYSFSFYILSQY